MVNWKGLRTFVPYFKVVSQHFPGGTKEKHETVSFRISQHLYIQVRIMIAEINLLIQTL
jgi:hypothetical protein